MTAALRRILPALVLSLPLISLPIAMHAQSNALTAAQSTPAQTTSPNDPERDHALQLFNAGKFVEGMFALEKVSVDHPNDAAVKEAWAFSMMAYAATLNDPGLRKKARVRARQIALQAKQMGDNSSLLEVVLEIPEDGSEAAFSESKEVNDVMKAAEADFSRGDLEKARNGYLHALLIEPKNYEAALFMGDTYFKQQNQVSAVEWFARAVEINPDRETAFRYWGDSLWTSGKSSDAREKYIRAIIAEPYNRSSWVGMSQWVQRTKVTLHWVKLQDKSNVSVQDNQQINITIDSSSLSKNDPAGAGWLIYGMNRALWHKDKFQKEFPNEPKYRHTLREESDSLHSMVTAITGDKGFEKHKKDLDPALIDLVQLEKSGLLEPFALLNRADGEIAQDYATYRETHRDVIYRYFDEFVVPKAPIEVQ
jgi:tetratricopeptide (TPR) repeat protein